MQDICSVPETALSGQLTEHTQQSLNSLKADWKSLQPSSQHRHSHEIGYLTARGQTHRATQFVT